MVGKELTPFWKSWRTTSHGEPPLPLTPQLAVPFTEAGSWAGGPMGPRAACLRFLALYPRDTESLMAHCPVSSRQDLTAMSFHEI